MARWVIVVVLVGLFLAVVLGIVVSARTYTNFGASFFPNLLATVIGVSLAAMIGIPVGFAINQYSVRLQRREHRAEVGALLEQVSREVKQHLANITTLTQTFSAQTIAQGTSRITPGFVALWALQDSFGRQFLASHRAFEIGEPLISFEVGSYYARVGDLNRLLSGRSQDNQSPDSWDHFIGDMLHVVRLAQQQVDFEIQKAIERLRTEPIR